MSDDLELDFCFDNDASASSFGWNFQVNAGIFLFLHYIKDAKSIKIESKKEDIEIALKDQKMVYAQAKSAQDECPPSNAKKKFKDAIVSLSKISTQNDNVVIYISNLREPIKGGDKFFDNKIVTYNECLKTVRTNVKNGINEIVEFLEGKIQDKSVKVSWKKKYQIVLENIKRMEMERLCICTIYPYHGIERNRYSEIKKKIIETFTGDIDIGVEKATGIAQELLEHWQLEFEHNSTIKDNTLKKNISKEEFIWPAIVYLSESESAMIDECLTFQADSSLKREALDYLQSDVNVYHERFSFVNFVLKDYEGYKKEVLGTSVSEVEKSYIKNQYRKFLEEFADIEDEQVKEYVLKSMICRIIMNNRLIQKVSKEVCL